MTRREWLETVAAALPGGATVLVHEHVLVDFIGADQIRPGRYDPEEVFRVAKPRLDEIKRLGCRRLLECTPAYLGRDPKLMARLAGATGLDIWINTGFYGAANHKYLPEFARTAAAGQLAQVWIREAREGVDGVKPRFIKIGVNNAPLNDLDRKLVRAAAIAARETGLTAASHTSGGGPAALEQIEIFRAERVSPARFVWVHAHIEKDHALHAEAARAGAWVEFDGIAPASAEWHLDCVRYMARSGLLHRTLISQDAGWYHAGEPGGGDYRGYTYIYTDFLPQLRPEWVRQTMAVNPVKAFGTA
jgi:phosphotriesterase-related protein